SQRWPDQNRHEPSAPPAIYARVWHRRVKERIGGYKMEGMIGIALDKLLAGRPGRDMGPASWSVSSIVGEVCMRAGIPPDRINLQRLEGSVEGIPYSPEDGAFSLIEALGQIFLLDRKSTRLNSSHVKRSYAVFCLKKKNRN